MADRTVTVRLRGDAQDLITAIDRASSKIDKLSRQVDRFGTARASATLGVDTSEGERRIAKMRGQLDRVSSSPAHADVDVDTAKADAELAGVEAGLDRVDGRTARARVSVNTSGAQRRFALLLSTATALGPALVPVGAELAALGLGAAGTVGALGAGAGTLELALKGTGAALKALDKQQQAAGLSAAQLATAQHNVDVAMSGLSVSGQDFVRFLYGLKPILDQLRGTAQAGLFPGLEEGITKLEVLLPNIDGLVSRVSGEFGHLASEAGDALTGPFWSQWFNFIEGEAAPTIDTFAHIIGNLATGFAGLIQAVAPLSTDVGNSLERLTGDFAGWSQQLDNSSGMHEFIDYVRENGHLVASTLASVATAVVAISRAAAPIGPTVLRAIQAFAVAVAAIANSPVGPALIGVASGLSAVNLALRLFDSVRAQKLVGMLGSIRSEGFGAASGISRFGLAAGGIAVGLPLIVEGLHALDQVLSPAPPNVDKLTVSLANLARTGQTTGALLATFGPDLTQFGDDLDKALNPSLTDKFTSLPIIGLTAKVYGEIEGFGNKSEEARAKFHGLDQALAGMVSSGAPQMAATLFQQLSLRASDAGFSVGDLKKLLPEYEGALSSAAAQTAINSQNTSDLSDAQYGLATNTQTATQAMQAQNDLLHGMVDPVFGLHEALGRLRDAQQKYNDLRTGKPDASAVQSAQLRLQAAQDRLKQLQSTGKSSAAEIASAQASVIDAQKQLTQVQSQGKPTAQQLADAQFDVATAALGVTDAANTLSGALDDGTTSAAQMREQLAKWAQQGLLTTTQANDLATALGKDADKAHALDSVDAKPSIDVDDSEAKRKLDEIQRRLDKANDTTTTVNIMALLQGAPIPIGIRAPAPPVSTGLRATARAKGGGVGPNQWAWVGEQGAELVHFGARAMIYSHPASMAMAGLAGLPGLAYGGPVGEANFVSSPSVQVVRVVEQPVQYHTTNRTEIGQVQAHDYADFTRQMRSRARLQALAGTRPSGGR